MLEMQIRRFPPLDYQAREAINTLCTNLSFAGGDIKKIMITSCRPQEGKSFVSMNLMRALANLGLRVVLVDADIRASALQGAYDIQINLPDGQKYPGLSRYLAGQCGLDEILAVTDIPNACMILAGRNVINSLPLLNSPRLGMMLDALAGQFDVVLVDASPVGTIIDAAKIAGACDGTLLVVQSGEISHTELRDVMQQLEKAGSLILGTVLNQYDEQKYGGKYYYGDYYYGESGGASAKTGKFRKYLKKIASPKG